MTKDDIYNKKGITINNFSLSNMDQKMFILTNDKAIVELQSEFKDCEPEIQLPYSASRVLINKNNSVVILSTNQPDKNGTVVLYSYPIDARSIQRKVDINAHISGINDMCFSSDEQLLFTASKDNCLMIYNIKEKEINYQSFKESSLPWSTELLISAEQKKAQQDKKRTLTNDIQESKYENEKKIDVQKLTFNNKLSELKENKSYDLDRLEHD